MRRIALFVVVAEAAAVAGFAVAIRSRSIPLGVPGEWEWLRVTGSPEILSVAFALVAIGCFAAVVAWGFSALGPGCGTRREGFCLAALVVAAVMTQGVVQEAAPIGFGLSKWIFALFPYGSSGYYTVAKTQMDDPRKFLADYPVWIEKQDALHVGTHPPGLFLIAKGMLSLMEANPGLSRAVVSLSPSSVFKATAAFRESDGLPRADGAGLAVTGALTLIACSLTVVPLYLLARSMLPAREAWVSASLWPLVPSALMFQPAADTAFPLLSTTALALACWAGRGGLATNLLACFLAGLTLALGMFCTLAFLPVGLIVAMILMAATGSTWPRRAGLIVMVGLGFLAGTASWWWATSANPVAIWWVNQQNHGRFYVEYPRSYAAWLIENPLELAVALGLPTTIWASASLSSPRQVPAVSWATVLVLVILTLSGKNLSEVARLWLPLMPPLLVAAGIGFTRLGGRGGELAATVVLIGVQVLILEATIQVVYPV